MTGASEKRSAEQGDEPALTPIERLLGIMAKLRNPDGAAICDFQEQAS